ncbi:MAG: DUF47 domain-containing protein [Candidatus Aenigmarchaeota archaeon]|nr:DUF47 domain-containing protein [Candidatus Aenigmarchaeota archaeon]
MSVLEWFIPRETKFFAMLKNQSENLLLGAREFEKLVKNYSKLSAVKKEAYAKSIADIEHNGDVMIHAIVDALNKTLITPIDREDIYRLTSLLDDVLDSINAAATGLHIFRIEKMDKFILEMTGIITEIVTEVHILVKQLGSNHANHGEMKGYLIKINRLENEADMIFKDALTALFKNRLDAVAIIKYKNIYEILETVTDKAEDVGNVVEGIVVKHG